MMRSSALSIFINSSILSLSATVIMGVMNYGIRRSLALNLTPEAFGFFYSAFSLLMIFLALLDRGLSRTGTILVARHLVAGEQQAADRVYKQTFLLKLIGSLVVVAGLLLAAEPLTRKYFTFPGGALPFIWLAMLVPCIALETAPLSAFDAAKDFTVRNGLQVVRIALTLLGVLVFVPRYGLLAAVVAFPLPSLVIFLVGTPLLYRRHGLSPALRPAGLGKDIGHVLRHSRWIACSIAGLTAMVYLDTQMLTVLDSLASVGIYSIAISITQILQSLMVFPVIFTPIATELWQRGEALQIRRVNQLMQGCLGCFLWPVLIVLLPFAGDIITLLFSSEFRSAGPALIILSVGLVFFSLAQFYIHVLNVMGMTRYVAGGVLAGVVANVIANAALIPRLGMNGAALATSFSYLVILGLLFRRLHARRLAGYPRFTLVALSGCGAALAAGNYLFCQTATPLRSIVATAVAVLLFSALATPYLRKLWLSARSAGEDARDTQPSPNPQGSFFQDRPQGSAREGCGRSSCTGDEKGRHTPGDGGPRR